MTSGDGPTWLQLLLQAGIPSGVLSLLTLFLTLTFTRRQARETHTHERLLAREERAAEVALQRREKKEDVLLAFQDEALAQIRILDERQVLIAEAPAGVVLEHPWDHERLFQLLCRAQALSSVETSEAGSRLRQTIVDASNFVEGDESFEALTSALDHWIKQVREELALEVWTAPPPQH